MSDTFNTTTSLTAVIKDVHDDIVKAIPEQSKFQREYAIDTTRMAGRKILVPVILSNCHGVTYSKANNGAFALNDAVPMTVSEAQYEPAQILVKEVIDYESVFRTENGQKVAYKPAVQLVMKAMVDSISKDTEMSILYGQSQSGYGKVNANTSSVTTLVVSADTWSGYWYGMNGKFVQLASAAWAADRDTSEKITAIDPDTRTITLTNNQTLTAGDLIAPLGTVTTNGTPANVVYQQMAGVDKIVTNTGTLFNISAATYPDTWKGNTVTVTGDPTMGKLMQGVSKVAGAGCDVGLIAWVSPKAYERLNSDFAALRRLDNGYRPSKVESGAESLVFYGQTGRLAVMPHPYVMDGHSFILPDGESGLVKRYASTDITFKRQGGSGESDMAVESSGVAGFELRAYTGQQIGILKPAWSAKVTGFTYS